MEPCKILNADTGRHPAFFQFIDTVFHGSRTETWTRWRDHGGWTDDYEVFAIVDGGKIVSTIGRSRMQLVINGEDQMGYQLGAVATLESYRRQGLARRLMHRVIDELDEPEQPIILFANNSALDFYPRMGFKRIPQRRSTAKVFIEPSSTHAPRFDPSSAADRSRLANLCARARPSRGPLAARDYHWILLWNLICGPATAFWLREDDALVATSVEKERLVIHDVIATRPFDLESVIPALITQPVMELEFLFDPEGFWQAAIRSEFDDMDLTLFARGRAATIARPVQFPELAHT
jgi:predicted N-acetyltransferase YhbS